MRKSEQYFLVALTSAAALAPSAAGAGATITIQNPNAVQYGINASKVYLRNLDQFDSSWLGCCYNYWFDLSTDTGRAQFSTFLSYKALGRPIQIQRAGYTTSGAIDMIGEW